MRTAFLMANATSVKRQAAKTPSDGWRGIGCRSAASRIEKTTRDHPGRPWRLGVLAFPLTSSRQQLHQAAVAGVGDPDGALAVADQRPGRGELAVAAAAVAEAAAR